MAVKVFSCMNFGLQGKLVEVEVDILRGLPAFAIVGLGDTAVQEAKERIRSAIKNSGAEYPQQKKIINLAPANLRKHGPQFDLPMAIGLLAASGQIEAGAFSKTIILGELALDGAVRPVRGVLTAALFAKENGWERIIIPKENFEEASLVKDLEILPITKLSEVFAGMSDKIPKNAKIQKQNGSNKTKINAESVPGHTLKSDKSVRTHTSLSGKSLPVKDPAVAVAHTFSSDINDIHGHEQAKRALQIAAAGGHHLALLGSPGVGKTLLAKAMPSILPPLSEQEMFEVMQIYSAAGLLQNTRITSRPFRQVHPSCTPTALTGGSSSLKPGEISLAHNGVLFMDELPEFPRTHLEHLRKPLEEKEIIISRAQGTVKYPAKFTLIAGMNPCPCGYHGDPKKECVCRPYQILQYQKKISGPIMDRIDLFVEMQRQPAEKFRQPLPENPATDTDPTKNPIQQIKQKIQAAHRIQQKRFKNSKTATNSEMTPREIRIHCPLNKESQNLLTEAADKLTLSGRQYHQTIKIARTIADLNQQNQISLENIAEALQYRRPPTSYRQ